MSTVDDFLRGFKAASDEKRQRILEDLKTKITRQRGNQTRSCTNARKWLDKALTLSHDIRNRGVTPQSS